MTLSIKTNSNRPCIKLWQVFGSLFIISIISVTTYLHLNHDSKDIEEPPSKLIFQNNVEATPDSTETEVEIELPSEEKIRLSEEWLPKIPIELEETEWLVIVDRSEQREYVFQNREFFNSYVVSTGSKDRYDYDATLPIGIWEIGEKIPYSLGELYGPKLMYLEWWNGESFEKTLKALHGTNEPENLGSPTSMGCVYHANDDILVLFNLIPEGTIVLTVE